jgi:hypothetical protein
MTSEELKRLFGNYAENAQFESWRKRESSGLRFVYACEFGTFWKFTPKEWWQFVTRTVRNNGGHDLVLSKALRSRPRHLIKGEDKKFYSTDSRVRCVNPLNWTFQDWTTELIPGGRGAYPLEISTADLRKPQLSVIGQKPAHKATA